MKKLVIILPVLFSVSICTGWALGLTTAEVADGDMMSHLLEAPAPAGSLGMLIPFATTADDGGALGEKAKVLVMRQQLRSGSPDIH